MPPADPAPPDRPRDTTRINLLFCGLLVTMLLASLNQTVLSPALPTIVGELDGVDQMLWAITAFTLATTIVMPVYGKLSDTFGRKPLLVIAISIFLAGSTCCALASTMPWLIAARVVQGLGAGGLMVLAQASIADVIPARERGRYMGIMSSVFALSSIAGPLLGGWLTEGPGWRWVFWINIPVGLIALACALAFLRIPHQERTDKRVDAAGISVLAIATTGLVLISGWAGTKYEWSSAPILALGASTMIAIVVFVAHERRTPAPVIPPHLFRERNFVCCTVAGLAMGVAMFGSTGYLPTYLQMATGADATEAGLIMIPMMVTMMTVSTVTGRVIAATGRYKAFPVTGTALVALALMLLTRISLDSPVWAICIAVGIMGAGLGMTLQVLLLIVQNTFPASQVGTATAANNYFRQIGATLGASVVGSLFVSRLMSFLGERLPAIGGSTTDGGSLTLTPAAVLALPDEVRVPIVESYNEALIPIFGFIAPLAIGAAVILLFVVESPLATTNRVSPESSEAVALDEFEVGVSRSDLDQSSGRRSRPSGRRQHGRAQAGSNHEADVGHPCETERLNSSLDSGASGQ